MQSMGSWCAICVSQKQSKREKKYSIQFWPALLKKKVGKNLTFLGRSSNYAWQVWERLRISNMRWNLVFLFLKSTILSNWLKNKRSWRCKMGNILRESLCGKRNWCHFKKGANATHAKTTVKPMCSTWNSATSWRVKFCCPSTTCISIRNGWRRGISPDVDRYFMSNWSDVVFLR